MDMVVSDGCDGCDGLLVDVGLSMGDDGEAGGEKKNERGGGKENRCALPNQA